MSIFRKLSIGTVALMLSSASWAAGTIDVAIVGEPDTLDPMMSTKDVVSIVTQHFYETLFTFNSKWEVVPLLAETMPEISADGLDYKIKIREGITFHDGSTMDAHDVVDSLNRWVEMSPRGKSIADKVVGISAIDDYNVEIKLNAAYAPLMSLLAFSNSAAVVYPQEHIGETIDAVIGTGPYKLAEHKPDQYIQLVKFDEYQSRSEPTDGGSGARAQTLDEIRFIPVADGNTRLEGVLSGEYDFADSLAVEAMPRLAESATAEPFVIEDFGWPMFVFNHKDGLNANPAMRSAIQAALSETDMLYAAFGDEAFFKVDGPLYPEGWVWRNETGAELYDQADAEKAKALAAEAGYDGKPIRILTSHQYEFHFKMAEVAKAYLEAAGFTVELDVVDWATLGERRNDPALWDIYISHSPFIPEPALDSLLYADSRVGWDNPEKNALLDEFNATNDLEARKALYAELQGKVMSEIPYIKVGNFNAVLGKSKSLSGVDQTPWPYFWNASVSE